MRLRKSECKAEPQHKSCAICQSHQQPCRWDLTAKLPAQGLSALSPAAGNAFSSKTLSHETKNYLTTEVNFGFSIFLFFFNWWWACNKEVKKTAAKRLKNRCKYFWIRPEAFSVRGLYTPDLQYFQNCIPKKIPNLTSRFETSTE